MATITIEQRRSGWQELLERLEVNRNLVVIYGALLLMVLISATISDTFRTQTNVTNVLRQAVALGMVSLGQTVVILTGGIDLSVGAIMTITAVYTSGIIDGHDERILPVMVFALGVGLLIGLANGLAVTRLHVPPFIVTLGSASVVNGLVLMYAKRSVGILPDSFLLLNEAYIGPIPFPVVFFAFLIFATWVILRLSVLGRYIYATGGNEEISRLSGIPTNLVKIFAYVFCAFTAVLSGWLLAARMGTGDPFLTLSNYELESIAAVLIGGTALAGGRGGIGGTIAGVFIVSVLNNILNLTDVNTYWQWIIKGLIIIGAMFLYGVRRRNGNQ